MIAHLRGILAEKEPHQVVIDVGGVGYRVFIPFSTFEKLPDVGTSVRLLTITYVREDAFHLYGFFTPAEREMFTVLNSVNGIGAKLALAALSTFSPEALSLAVVQEDVMTLARIAGVGKRIAMRLVVELKDRLPALPTPTPDVLPMSGEGSPPPAEVPASAQVSTMTLRKELIAALVNLGYRQMDAERVMRDISPQEMTDPALALRAALKILSR
ncbi:MAG: Holliday junction branch migration protein RuvA [Magnetococcus sp. YQC-5]